MLSVMSEAFGQFGAAASIREKKIDTFFVPLIPIVPLGIVATMLWVVSDQSESLAGRVADRGGAVVIGAVTAYLLWKAAYRIAVGIRHRKTRLLLNRLPLMRGEKFSGRVAATFFTPPDAVRVYFRCIEEYDDDGVQQRIVWQDERIVPGADLNVQSYGFAIPLSFTVPIDAIATSVGLFMWQRYWWQIDVEAEVPGIDFRASFEVPVAGD